MTLKNKLNLLVLPIKKIRVTNDYAKAPDTYNV